jgi:hypothetical protein
MKRDYETSRQLNAWSEFFHRRVDDRIYLVTFMFAPFRTASEYRTILVMEKIIETFYDRLLNRVTRYPERYRSNLIVLAFPDKPVPHRRGKRPKASFEMAPNKGLHYHAIVALKREGRSKAGLKTIMRKHGSRLIGGLPLNRLHVKRVKGDPRPTVVYCLKGLPRRIFSTNRILLLPKADSEF